MSTCTRFEMPNLDALDMHELAKFAQHIVTHYEIPLGNRQDLEQYALLKLNATALRKMGKVQKAQAIEARLEVLYRWIPAEYRW